MNKPVLQLRLKDKTAVFIDWANIYGWKKSLKRLVDPKKLYKYLKSYREIKEIHFFIFLTGDGDFEPLYKLLIEKKEQVIVIYAHGHLGREIYSLKEKIFKKAITSLNANLFL